MSVREASVVRELYCKLFPHSVVIVSNEADRLYSKKGRERRERRRAATNWSIDTIVDLNSNWTGCDGWSYVGLLHVSFFFSHHSQSYARVIGINPEVCTSSDFLTTKEIGV